jgi:hypothetical protein
MIYFKKTIFLLVLISISLFSCKKDSEQQNTNSENPCQSDCVETKEIFTSPANDIVFTTTNEYVIIADKKFISKKSILVAPNNQLNIWRYEYDNLGNILEFSNENIRTIDQTVSRTISQKYMYENGVLVRKNSYQDNELYGYVIYEYTQSINKYTKIIIYDTLGPQSSDKTF